jgi:hypothetical protein
LKKTSLAREVKELHIFCITFYFSKQFLHIYIPSLKGSR